MMKRHDKSAFEDEAAEALISEEHSLPFVPGSRRRNAGVIVPWTLAAFFFCTTLFLALRGNLSASQAVKCPETEVKDASVKAKANYESGFDSDFGIELSSQDIAGYVQLTSKAASSSPPIPIKIIKKHFTNDLKFNSSSNELCLERLSPNETMYIGEDRKAISKAWDDLLHAQFMALEPEEIGQIPPSHITPIFWNGKHDFLELAVFHNLHCLNEIRMALDGESSHHGRTDEGYSMNRLSGKVHLDHCIDQLRQAVMCHSDLTPVPMQEVPGVKGFYIGNGEDHTCRDFDAIWQWVEERGRKMMPLGS
jgi:hypothetical protein